MSKKPSKAVVQEKNAGKPNVASTAPVNERPVKTTEDVQKTESALKPHQPGFQRPDEPPVPPSDGGAFTETVGSRPTSKLQAAGKGNDPEAKRQEAAESGGDPESENVDRAARRAAKKAEEEAPPYNVVHRG